MIQLPDSTVKYQTWYYQYKDRIQNIETTQKLGNIRTQYEVGLKQSEVDLLKEKERNSKIIILSVSLVFFIALCLILLLLHYSRAIKKYNLKLEEQKNSLLKVNKTKDKYFSIISHDLRGPANVLAGIVSVIKRDLDNNEPEDIRDLIDNMSGMTEKLVKLLDNLLSWAILQQGNFPYNPKNISLASILKESVGMFTDMASSKDIEISYHMSEDIEVYVDKNSISTIFRNIINNAVKFTEPNGKILVSTEKDPTQKLAVIKIKDNGIGMPVNIVQSLFDNQSPKYSEGTEGEKGLGLGLQLVKDFIKLNNGSIEVDSKEDQGTEFVVSIPLARE
jgi:signal transduction histidine kinase